MNRKRDVSLVLSLWLLSVSPTLAAIRDQQAKENESISGEKSYKPPLHNEQAECSREVRLLLEQLHDRDPRERRDAALGLDFKILGSKLVGAEVRRVESALIRCLHDEDRDVRLRATRALTGIEPVAASAIPALINLARGDDKKIREWAMVALGRTRRSSKLLLSVLIKGLKDGDKGVRAAAAIALGEIGPAARSAIPELITSLQDPCAEVRSGSAYALSKIKNAYEALRPLMRALHDEHKDVRYNAADALGAIGEKAKPALADLRKTLKDPAGFVRVSSAFSLWQIDPSNDLTIPALVESLKDPDPSVRLEAIEAVRKIGPPARDALPTLEEIANYDKGSYTRKAASHAIKSIRKKRELEENR